MRIAIELTWERRGLVTLAVCWLVGMLLGWTFRGIADRSPARPAPIDARVA